MTDIEFCRTLKSSDRIIISISLLYSHHAIFWGWDATGQGWFLENDKRNGVRFITTEAFFFGFNGAVTTQVFVDSENKRQQAIERAISVIGTDYHITKWNCEQYANYVQFNQIDSPQVRNTFLATIAVGLWLGGRH